MCITNNIKNYIQEIILTLNTIFFLIFFFFLIINFLCGYCMPSVNNES